MKEECAKKRDEINSLINEINTLSINKIIEQGKDGEEHIVTYDISKAWEEYLFLLNGILYRWDNCYKYLIELLNEINKLFPEPRADDIQMCGVPACDKLSYEFENFLVAFPRLNEEPLMTNLSRTMSKVNAEQLKSNCFKKNDVNGLFWEINLLRNRFAHSTPGYYAANTEYAQRYMALSSKIYNIRIIKEKIVFNTTLINLHKNSFIKQVIQDVIIEKKLGEEKANVPLMELLFNEKPYGKRKNNPQMLFISNLEFFDLNSDFLILSLKIFDYIKNQLEIIKRELDNDK